MQVTTGRLQILTVAAILVLVSGGIAAYAQGQSSQYNPSTAPSNPGSGGTTAAGSAPVEFQPDDGTTTFSTTVTVTTTVTTTTKSTSTTTTSTPPTPLCTPPTQPGQPGRLVLPITAAGSQSGAISFSDGRGCTATITTVGGIFNVQIALRYAKPITQYNAVLVANGTSYTLGNMVTGPDGSGQMQNQVLLASGTYVVSIQIYDTSSNPGQSILVLQTGQGTIVSPPFPTSSGGDGGQPPTTGGQGQGQGGQGQGQGRSDHHG